VRDPTSPLKWIENSGVQVASLQANNYRAPLPTLERSFESLDIDPPFIVGWRMLDCIGSYTEQPHGTHDRFVPVLSRQNPDLWRACEVSIVKSPSYE